MAIVVVISTFPNPDKAAEVARVLVGEQLAACVNIAPAVRSIYRWNGEMCDDSEALAIVKTTNERVDALIARLIALHPYDVPEAIAMPVIGGHAAYLEWVAASTREPATGNRSDT
jgi:periplasmic divalent cation tolerance protein